MINGNGTNFGTNTVCRRGRPKLTCQVKQLRTTISLREGEDSDLLMFFSRIPERMLANTIKAILKKGIRNA